MKIASKKYLSVLAGVLFLLTFLMTGCAKDEVSVPLSEDDSFKSMQSYDNDRGGESRFDGDNDTSDDGITDDEDDEDDKDRTSKH